MRVLVVYATSRGGTAGLATMIAEAFIDHGVDAQVGAATEVDDLDGYDAVLVGGALYNNRWHPDATWFVERNLGTLRACPVWFFSSGPLDDSARSGALAPVAQVSELARRAEVRGHMTFGGVLDAKPAGLLGSLLSYGKPGDYRDPHQVAEWVEWIAGRLGQPRPAAVVLPDAEPHPAGAPAHPSTTPEPEGVAARLLHRLTDAGDVVDDAEDAGLDVLIG